MIRSSMAIHQRKKVIEVGKSLATSKLSRFVNYHNSHRRKELLYRIKIVYDCGDVSARVFQYLPVLSVYFVWGFAQVGFISY